MNEYDSYHDRPVRPYVVTGGRARPSRNTIRPETLLVVADAERPLPVSASSEERALLRMCHRLLSLVEAAVHLGLPVSVVSVVASDLIDSGFLAARRMNVEGSQFGAGQEETPGRARPDRKFLQEVLDGLRKLR
ncbi:MAG: DUF742 domain-containing protein [Nocardiopsaceae bacterium]|nr:DUF742 domain-containing protein [Nocardiopsaceae bacterium]